MRWFAKVFLCMAVLQGMGNVSAACLVPGRGQGQENQVDDKPGPYVIGNEKDRSKKEAEVRSYLWHHWRQRIPGRLVVTWISKEGQESNATYVLEPDDHGTWRIETTWERPGLKSMTAGRSKVRAYDVRRIEVRHDGQSPAKFIPEKGDRSGETYRLVFYDAKGEEVGGV